MKRTGTALAAAALAASVALAGKPGELTLKAPPIPIKSVNSPEMNRMQNAAISRMTKDIRLMRARIARLEKRLEEKGAEGVEGVKPVAGPGIPAPSGQGAIYVVRTYGANVRTGPSTKFPILRQHRQGDLVLVVGEKDGWYRLGPGGWIFSGIVLPAVSTASADALEKAKP